MAVATGYGTWDTPTAGVVLIWINVPAPLNTGASRGSRTGYGTLQCGMAEAVY